MRFIRFCSVLGSIVALSACTTGSGGTSITPGMPEAGNQQLGIICSTFYAASGTFVPNTADPPPDGFNGCWPIGTWTFALTVSTDASMGGGIDSCASSGHALTPLAQYSFTGTTSLDTDGDPVEHFTYNPQSGDPTLNYTAKVTEGGSGVCEGTVALYDSTGTKVLTLTPELNADNSITGNAEFDLWPTDQWSGS
jgi:hypothetical protein